MSTTSRPEQDLRMVLGDTQPELAEFFELAIEDLDIIDDPDIPADATFGDVTDIYYTIDGASYTNFLFAALTFGILWEREDSQPTAPDRFEAPFGYESLTEFITSQSPMLKSAMMRTLDWYEETGEFPSADVYENEFPSEIDRSVFPLATMVGCIIQQIGKTQLQTLFE